ncbi:MAG: 1-deoxy-D-xylulose-5-phosphate synthase [Omnitrophica WOR_2 bacterium SM23_72]|nr:MAG: 1-deoxy-D-xylulose-5-phosphate synthase [Omnitrophica WOR_2 bacterium SM23_72]
MLLEKIHSPQDLKKLKPDKLPRLAQEIRQRIVEVVASCGGHLASSLGAVELILALHYCLDARRDKIIFDVGHQAYAHKILTGRNKDFYTLRQYQGLSGFPCKEESVCDCFTTGHSSTAVSLALGLACARDFLPRESYFKVVAVIGDGSLSGGLCFEGLNNAGHLRKDILVILNTNELSIAPNAGAISTYLNKIISLPIYNRFKDSLQSFVKSRMPKGSRLIKIANKFEEGLKGMFIPGMFFEEMGFRYFGPFDGHDVNLLVRTLKNIDDLRGPLLLHVVTKKGKGYAPAEQDPVRFHGTGPFDVLSGANVSKEQTSPLKTYTGVFSEKLLDCARRDSRIIAITAAMPEGTGLDKFRDRFPQRFFDVGIAEAHAICFAAGLSQAGLKPVVAIYSTFLQRAYDQLIEDIALQQLPVVFMLDRAGIVGEDGATHQGIFDIGYLRNIPHFVVMAPKDAEELELMLEFAIGLDRPCAIRYPRDKIPNSKSLPVEQAGQIPNKKIELGKAEVLKEGEDFVLLALGSMVYPGLEAMDLLHKQGLSGTLINARFVKPLDVELFRQMVKKFKFIFSAEEGILEGGFGSAVAEALDCSVHRIGLPCAFIPHGKRALMLDKYGLTAQGIAERIRSVLR